jgi:hypothetical protein
MRQFGHRWRRRAVNNTWICYANHLVLIGSSGLYVCRRGGPEIRPLHRDLQWSIVLYQAYNSYFSRSWNRTHYVPKSTWSIVRRIATWQQTATLLRLHRSIFRDMCVKCTKLTYNGERGCVLCPLVLSPELLDGFRLNLVSEVKFSTSF